jgi:hypothetical protein
MFASSLPSLVLCFYFSITSFSSKNCLIFIFSQSKSLGSILGTGGFCKVFEITKITSCCDENDNDIDINNDNNNDNDDDIDMNDTDDNTEIIDNVDHDNEHEHDHNHDNNNDGENITQTKFYMSQNVYRNKNSTTHDNNNKNNHKNNARYAIKILHTTFDKKTTKRRGMYDLAVEASYLSALDHPNIIKMRGSLECGQQNSSQLNSQFTQQEDQEAEEQQKQQQQQQQQRILHSANPVKANGFFIVMDRLYDTLQEKIDIEWTKEYKDGSGSFFGLFNKDTRKLKNLFLERLIVAHDLAKVFQYLHEKK